MPHPTAHMRTSCRSARKAAHQYRSEPTTAPYHTHPPQPLGIHSNKLRELIIRRHNIPRPSEDQRWRGTQLEHVPFVSQDCASKGSFLLQDLDVIPLVYDGKEVRTEDTDHGGGTVVRFLCPAETGFRLSSYSNIVHVHHPHSLLLDVSIQSCVAVRIVPRLDVLEPFIVFYNIVR